MNFSKTKSLYREGMSPLVKSSSRPKWWVTYNCNKTGNIRRKFCFFFSPQNNLFHTVNFAVFYFSNLKNYYYKIAQQYVSVYVTVHRVRIPPKHVYYYRCPDHRKNYVMSFAFNFDREADVYQFAYCYPYSYTRLQNYLDNLEKKRFDFFQRELLCLTVVIVLNLMIIPVFIKSLFQEMSLLNFCYCYMVIGSK